MRAGKLQSESACPHISAYSGSPPYLVTIGVNRRNDEEEQGQIPICDWTNSLAGSAGLFPGSNSQKRP
jgi:hypothetical protein